MSHSLPVATWMHSNKLLERESRKGKILIHVPKMQSWRDVARWHSIWGKAHNGASQLCKKTMRLRGMMETHHPDMMEAPRVSYLGSQGLWLKQKNLGTPRSLPLPVGTTGPLAGASLLTDDSYCCTHHGCQCKQHRKGGLQCSSQMPGHTSRLQLNFHLHRHH